MVKKNAILKQYENGISFIHIILSYHICTIEIIIMLIMTLKIDIFMLFDSKVDIELIRSK